MRGGGGEVEVEDGEDGNGRRERTYAQPYSSGGGTTSTARRLHRADRDLCKLFTPAPHCGHFPCGGGGGSTGLLAGPK